MDQARSILHVQEVAYRNGYEQGISKMQEIYKVLGWQGGTIHQVVERIKELLEHEQELAEARDDRKNM